MIDEGEIERFRLEIREHLSPQSLQVRSGNILVAVHDPKSVTHLQKVLDEIDPRSIDVVVLAVTPKLSGNDKDLAKQAEQVVDDYATPVFSRVVHVAERLGKPVRLAAVAGKDPYSLILQTAQKLRSSRVILGQSAVTSTNEQEREIHQAWEQLPTPRPEVRVEIVPEANQAPTQIALGSSDPGR